jgi:hypothetical protein
VVSNIGVPEEDVYTIAGFLLLTNYIPIARYSSAKFSR